MNWNTRNFVSLVHRRGRRYVFSQFTVRLSYYIFLRQPFSLAFKRGGGLFFDNGFVNGFIGFF